MISERMLSDIDSVAEELVTADPYDLREVGKILDYFQKIYEEAKSSELKRIADAAEAAVGLVKDMILDEKIDREETFDVLNKTVSALQQMTRPGADQEQIDFPEKLPLQDREEKKSAEKFFSLPAYLGEEIFNEFLNEQDSVLEKMESHLLKLEIDKDKDKETIADLRRIFHTLKGETAIFELNDVEKLCHTTEDLIDSSGENLPIDKLLAVKDWLKDVFDALKNKSGIPELDEQVLSMLKPEKVAEEEKVEESIVYKESVEPEEIPEESKKIEKTTEIQISGDVDLLTDFVSEVQEHIDNIDNKLLSLESNPEDFDLLNAVFRVFHTIKGAAGFLALDDISNLAHTTENLLDLARKGEIILTGGKIDIVFEAIDVMKKMVSDIKKAISSGLTSCPAEPSMKKLIDKIHDITSVKAIGVVSDSSEPETILPEEKEKTETELNEQQPEPSAKESMIVQEVITKKETYQQSQVRIKESIKVDSENLDKLIDSIGELVIIQSMIKQNPEINNVKSSTLMRNITQMDKITRELQQLGMSLRMIPVKATFQKMARVVRDLAKKSNKKIEFIAYGEDTMLDKSVVDRIGDPLIHLVRNSVDHGIEQNSEDRKRAGKHETGRIELKAFHKGGNIHIEIRDDGQGLDKEAILEKFKDIGLIRDGQGLSDREIFDLIFLPGFSTAKKVTDVSGRGVGMDVVKKAIEGLRGNIDITSEPGRGCIFSLRLPLTLAIIDGMLVRIGMERYTIPTLSIVKSVRPKKEDVLTVVNRGEMVKIRDDLIPLFRLADLFKIEGARQDPTESIVVVVEDSGKMTGLLVDELLGQQSTVIKSLGSSFKRPLGISGGSIMSDGSVGIILDVAGIVKLATTQNTVEQQDKKIASL